MENNDYNFNDESNLPLNNNGKDSFGLPSDYFSSFEDKLRKKIESQEELNEFSLLSSIQKNNLFTTPDNYFTESVNTLEIKTELAAYPQLQGIKPFHQVDLDVEYTNALQSSISYKVELVEELNDYKLLYSIDKVNSFVVSENYFESISENVKEKLFAVKETKISIFDNVLDFIFGKKMAFAFGLVTIISLSIYFYDSTEKPLEMGDCKTLACLERQEILNNNKVISNFDDEQIIDLVDINKLNNQLNSEKEKKQTNKSNMDSISDDDILDEL